MTVLTNGIFHTGDVQPTDDHPKELQRGTEGGAGRREGGADKGGREN